MVCHGSVKAASAAPPRPSSPWAADGTEAHELLEFALRGRFRVALEAYAASDLKWEHRTDDESARLDSVQVALDYVYDLLDTYDDAEMFLERNVPFPTMITDDCGGTNDVIIAVPALMMMWVIDFKHGAGVAVEVDENKQLMMYGVLAVTDPDTREIARDFEQWAVTLVIVQPRAFHALGPVREWPVPNGRLAEFVPEVEAAIIECEGDAPVLVPGDAQCRWCPVVTTCPAVERRAMQAVAVNFASVREITRDILPKIADLPADRLSYILQAQDMLETWFKEAYMHALELAKAGYSIPGFKLVEADARRKFSGNEADVAVSLMKLTGAQLDEVYPRSLIGIGDAEKLIVASYKAALGTAPSKAALTRAARDGKQAMALLTVKDTTGKLSLAPAGDRRQAVTVQSQFGAVALPLPGNST